MEFRKDNMSNYCKNCYELQEQLEAYKMEAEEGKEINAELKAENEVLKNFHINLVGVHECDIKELLKLKQTLVEIKEIAEFSYRPYRVCGEYNNCCEIVAKILSKISEVEDEN